MAFDWGVIDSRYAIFQKLKSPHIPINKHALTDKFDVYLRQRHQQINLGELSMRELSDNVTLRYIEYIPVVVALLGYKLPGCAAITQRAMVEVSFRIADIMIAFRQKDGDKIIHTDLVLFYNEELMNQKERELKLRKNKSDVLKYSIKDVNRNFYPDIFKKISEKLQKDKSAATKSVIRIYLLLNGMCCISIICSKLISPSTLYYLITI